MGKTWLLREFARREYKNNLLRELFEKDFDTERLLRGLRAISGVDITPGDTLVILDEIQEIPEALESLKYFCENAPEYHIAVAGSLLGLSLHAGVSFPVGKIDILNVYPMSFEEFLLAKGETEILKPILSCDFDTLNIVHDKCIELLRQYYYVGGMPEAVAKYVATGELWEVRGIQQRILLGYEQDFSKHAPTEQVSRIRQVWKSVPSQLFKENKKFIYSALRHGARAKDFEMAIQWLLNSGLLYKVSRCTKPSLPLDIYEDLNAFKLFLLDVGLLGAITKTEPSQVLIKNDAFTEYNGGFTEQFVLQQMMCHEVAPIYYYKTDDSRLEMDFVIQRDAKLLPIEVKAGGNVRSNSLSTFLANHPDIHAVRYSMLPYREQEHITNVPLYAVR